MAFNYFTSGTSFNFTLLEGEFAKILADNVTARIVLTFSDGTTQAIDIQNVPYRGSIGGYTRNTNVSVVIVNGSGRLGIDYDGFDVPVAASRLTEIGDDKKVLSNRSASAYTLTVAVNTITYGFIFQQLGTGTCTIAAGAGVTFIGSTLATATAGQKISVLPTDLPNTFNVSVG